jgi:hypothetical protein
MNPLMALCGPRACAECPFSGGRAYIASKNIRLWPITDFDAPSSALVFADTMPRHLAGASMRRREFISLGEAGWPLVARAQQPARVRRPGVLMGVQEDDHALFSLPIE